MTEPQRALPPCLQAKVDQVKDFERAAFELRESFLYPIDANGNVLDINQLNHLYPDLLPGLIHHLVKAGWRRVEEKRHIKARKVVAAGMYEDMVAWVPMDAPDDPIRIETPADVSPMWSVKPTVTDVFEERE